MTQSMMCINTYHHLTVELFMFISIFPNSAKLHMKQWKHGVFLD